MATKQQKRVGIGIAAVAATAAAAGAYWLYGSEDAPKHRKQARSWMLRARAEVLEHMEKLGEVDKAAYLRIVDEVLKSYAGAVDVTSAEIGQVTRDLKAAWQRMQSAAKRSSKGFTKVAKKKRARAKKATK